MPYSFISIHWSIINGSKHEYALTVPYCVIFRKKFPLCRIASPTLNGPDPTACANDLTNRNWSYGNRIKQMIKCSTRYMRLNENHRRFLSSCIKIKDAFNYYMLQMIIISIDIFDLFEKEVLFFFRNCRKHLFRVLNLFRSRSRCNTWHMLSIFLRSFSRLNLNPKTESFAC